ncbi:hypothetical protein [Levilactobacillus brevis]|uniref:hypothetical protein n=1 Tax=Levilactobacillus brevis TaxID=1580 RepID=UPI0021A62B38|nr:hypothetical protein [Levilactobacillus brevis]
MMALLTTPKLKCFNCGNSFPVNFQKALRAQEIQCPYCFTKVEESSLDKVFSAMGEIQDVNADLVKYHTDGRDEPLFQLEFESTEVKKPYANN